MLNQQLIMLYSGRFSPCVEARVQHKLTFLVIKLKNIHQKLKNFDDFFGILNNFV